MTSSNKLTYSILHLYLQVVLPFEIIYKLYTQRRNTIFDYILLIVQSLAFIYFIYLYCYWEYSNYYFRYIWLFTLAVGVIYAIYRITLSKNIIFGGIQSVQDDRTRIIIIIVTLSIINMLMIVSKYRCKSGINLIFPFKKGNYLINEAGDGKMSFFSNYHYYFFKFTKKLSSYDAMRFAVDIIKVNKYGFSNKPFIPLTNTDYYIYEEDVFSPSDGEVIEIANNKEDNVPHSSNLSIGGGNYVVIKNEKYYIALLHFKNDSIVLYKGQFIKAGDFIGKVGNSGYSPRPHLHIQAMYCEGSNYWRGKGVPIKFDNKLPFRNKIVRA